MCEGHQRSNLGQFSIQTKNKCGLYDSVLCEILHFIIEYTGFKSFHQPQFTMYS